MSRVEGIKGDRSDGCCVGMVEGGGAAGGWLSSWCTMLGHIRETAALLRECQSDWHQQQALRGDK